MLSSLGASSNPSTLLAIESELSIFKVFGYDFGDTDRELWITVDRYRFGVLHFTVPSRYPEHGKLYDTTSSPLVLISPDNPFLSLPMKLIPCTTRGLSIPTDIPLKNLRCGVSSIGYISDPSYFRSETSCLN